MKSLQEFSEAIEKVKSELKKWVVGQDTVIEEILVSIFAEGHIIIEGVPGLAKTLIVKILAQIFDIEFKRIQFTPDLMPSDILGNSIFNPKSGAFEFHPGPIFANFILIDEINRAPAKTQSALFEVMEEKQVTQDGTTYKLQKPFFVIATQNPIEQEGTYRLPEAQLDRFLMHVIIDYPSLEEEVQILRLHHNNYKPEFSNIQKLLNSDSIVEFQSAIKQVKVNTQILYYIANLTQNTRTHNSLYLGASPRASIALLNCSKVKAALNQRDFVTPEDVKEIAASVLRHRISLTPDKEILGVSAQEVIEEITNQIEVPR